MTVRSRLCSSQCPNYGDCSILPARSSACQLDRGSPFGLHLDEIAVRPYHGNLPRGISNSETNRLSGGFISSETLKRGQPPMKLFSPLNVGHVNGLGCLVESSGDLDLLSRELHWLFLVVKL